MRNQPEAAIRLSVLAVQGALLAIAAPHAFAQADIADLTQPTSVIEVGAMNVSQDAPKFGQYTGLDKKGGYAIGNVELRGGGYNTDNDARRWSVSGTDLGLDSRSLSVEYRDQGKFKINFGYDELLSNRSNGYKTPYSGAGSNSLTLPATWNLLKTSNTVANALPTTGLATGSTPGALTAADLASFQNIDLKTKRKKTDLGFAFDINPNWSLSASVKHEDKDGVQAIGQTFYNTSAGQVTLPNPIHYTTDQINLALNFKGDNYYSQLSYYGSFFKDDYSSVTFSNAYQVYGDGSAPLFGRFSTAPDNQFHQLNWNGGYNFSKTTKLVADLSYSRSTQNESFIPATSFDLGTVGAGASAVGAQPRSSLNSLVVNKFVNIKLTTKPIDKLSLTAAYKHDDRDNRTPVDLYLFRWADTTGRSNTTGAGFNDYQKYNTPYSKKVDNLNLVADYALGAGQAIKGTYNWERIDRSCNAPYPVSTSVPPTGWGTGYNNCVNVPTTKEDTLGLEYRKTLGDTVTGRVGVSEARRRGSAYKLDVTQGAQTASSTYSTYQTDIPGLQRFNYADRNREKIAGAINWDASEHLGLSAGVDYKRDKYSKTISDPGGATYGLDHSDGWALNLDASYRVSDSTVLNAYYSYDEMKTRQTGNNATSVAISGTRDYTQTHWSADIKDQTDTFGFGFKTAGLMGNKLELGGDLAYSRSRSPISLGADPTICSIGTTTVCVAGVGLLPLPESYAKSTVLKLTAKYTVDKASAIRFTYQYAKLSSSDYAYLGLQPGAATSSTNTAATSVLMPTFEQAPNYSVNVVGVSYIYSFK